MPILEGNPMKVEARAGAKSVLCSICGKFSSTKETLVQHMKNVHLLSSGQSVIECDHCCRKFLQRNAFIWHFEAKHANNKLELFHCDFDGKSFRSKSRLHAHMLMSHQTPVTCRVCERTVKNISQHMRLVHPSTSERFECKICAKTVKSKWSLERHVRGHEKRHQCQVCGWRFSHKFRLKEHMRLHENPHAFRCEICSKNFRFLSGLTNHRKLHDANREKAHKCHHCDFETHQKANLKTHILRKHEAEKMVKAFKCTHCDYASFTRSQMRCHRLTHERNLLASYCCPLCDYRANFRSRIDDHLKTHDKDPNSKVKCTLCSFSCTLKRQMTRHVKIKHGGGDGDTKMSASLDLKMKKN